MKIIRDCSSLFFWKHLEALYFRISYFFFFTSLLKFANLQWFFVYNFTVLITMVITLIASHRIACNQLIILSTNIASMFTYLVEINYIFGGSYNGSILQFLLFTPNYILFCVLNINTIFLNYYNNKQT